jgi:hypothetical protein
VVLVEQELYYQRQALLAERLLAVLEVTAQLPIRGDGTLQILLPNTYQTLAPVVVLLDIVELEAQALQQLLRETLHQQLPVLAAAEAVGAPMATDLQVVAVV